MQKMGRRHRPFFRIVAVDGRAARDGKVIEYLGNYDPLIGETDARAALKNERIDYWLSVGAQPSDRVGVLIKKYGSQGTHLDQQKEALNRLAASKPTAPPPVAIPKPKTEEPAAEAAATEEATAESTEKTAAAEAPEAATETTEVAEAAEAPAEQPDASEGEPEETKE
jgi:small subunit ribosomal protein S16